ncbi:MAG: SOS response-associated peptidase [Pseudomonadota bacterium]
MCGRLNLSDLDGIRHLMAQIGMPLFQGDDLPRYNVAPSTSVPVLLGDDTAEPRWARARWGFRVRTQAASRDVFNARSESIDTKPLFCDHVGVHRAVMPASGFYEWARRGAERQAYHFSHSADSALLMASLWRRDPDGRIETATLTTAANSDMRGIHDRMPLLLRPSEADRWLHGDWRGLLSVPASGVLTACAVASHVNNAKHDAANCLAPAETEPFTPDLFGS